MNNKYAVFYGPHDATLDVKHRMLLPSELRRCIDATRDGASLFAVVGMNDKIWLMTENAYLEQAAQPLNLTPGKKQIARNLLWYGTVRRLEFDGNGRILVPKELLDETKTTNAVTLVGSNDHIQVWNREEWRAIQAELKAERKRQADLAEAAEAAIEEKSVPSVRQVPSE